MDFELSEEQRFIQQAAREFADEAVRPGAAERDEKAVFPTELVEQLGELGFMGIAIPEEWGGTGAGHLGYLLALEEISRADASVGVIMSVNNSLACEPIYRYGSEGLKEKYLKRLAGGEMLGAYALTEPGAGSDAGALKTSALKNGDEYVLNGSKAFITNGDSCDVMIVYAKTDPEASGSKGISAFVVEKGTPGFEVGKHEDKLGIRGSDCVPITFEDCRVPAGNMLGEEGQGFKIALSTLNGGRIGIAAQALGIAQGALDVSIRYAKERHQFGRPISGFGAIQGFLADMGTSVEAARMLVYRASNLRDRGLEHASESAMAKLFASEKAVEVTKLGVQIHGGYGYTKAYPIERFYRDAKVCEIYEGTSEVQRLVIAKGLLTG